MTALASTGNGPDAAMSDAEALLSAETGTQDGTPPTTSAAAPSAGSAPILPTSAASAPMETSGSTLKWPAVVEGVAPLWPFEGVVNLWSRHGDRWWLRYWSPRLDAETMRQVPLPGMEIDCLGAVGLVAHGERGIEVGGAPGAVSGSFLLRWGESAQRLEEPSDALLAEIDARPSTLEAGSIADEVWLEADGQRTSYAMRRPPRAAGEWWRVQARHDGGLLVMSVHPANHECFSGVTWLADAATGEVVACGANTWATRFVGPDEIAARELVLPDPDEMGSYLACGARLDLTQIPIHLD